MKRVFTEVNNGVYRCGFAGSQEAYDDAYERLWTAMDWLEDRLADRRYLMGDAITEADVRLFTTLVRFDAVYHGHFKCNRNKLTEMPHLWALRPRPLPDAGLRRRGRLRPDQAALLRRPHRHQSRRRSCPAAPTSRSGTRRTGAADWTIRPEVRCFCSRSPVGSPAIRPSGAGSGVSVPQGCSSKADSWGARPPGSARGARQGTTVGTLFGSTTSARTGRLAALLLVPAVVVPASTTAASAAEGDALAVTNAVSATYDVDHAWQVFNAVDRNRAAAAVGGDTAVGQLRRGRDRARVAGPVGLRGPRHARRHEPGPAGPRRRAVRRAGGRRRVHDRRGRRVAGRRPPGHAAPGPELLRLHLHPRQRPGRPGDDDGDRRRGRRPRSSSPRVRPARAAPWRSPRTSSTSAPTS